MAGLIKRFYLPCVEGWKFSKLKTPPDILTHLAIPRRLLCTAPDIDHKQKRKGWRRIKKNDPGMEDFLSSPDVQERITELAKVMRCSIQQATELVKRDSDIGIRDKDSLFKIIDILLSYKFSVESIIANPAVLHRNHSFLQQRLHELETLRDPPNSRSVNILKSRYATFKRCLETWRKEDEILAPFSSRQQFIASLFDCDENVAKTLIDTYEDFTTMSPIALKAKVDIFRRFLIPSSVFRAKSYIICNLAASVIEQRLQILSDNDLLDPPYSGVTYLPQKSHDFDKFVRALKERKSALEGCEDKTDYLVFRLNCSKKVAERLANTVQVQNLSDLKLKKMLDFFLEEMGMSSDFVTSNIYLMAYSLDRMQMRWDYISNFSGTIKSIPRLLSMSDEDFTKYMKV